MINSSMTGASPLHRAHHQGDTQNRQNFKSLSSSLQSGDLAGATKAFQALTANAAKSGPGQNSQIAKDLSAVGQALQSGDLSGAQKAFAAVQSDIHARRPQHMPPVQPGQQAKDADGDNDGSTGAINIAA